MGNMLTAFQEFAWSLKRQASVRSRRSEPEVVQEDLLLLKLMELQKVELWRVHWCLSQELLRGFPPIPRHWLQSADANSTAKAMRRCYNEEGVLTMLDAALTMLGPNDWVSHLHPTMDPPRPRLAPKPNLDFLKTQRRKLISRMQWLDSVLDALQDHGILSTTNREAINIYAVHKEKNRAMVDLVLRKGDEAQEVFYKALSQSEPFLLQELEDGPMMDKNPLETCPLSEMLEFLVSNELRSFQWLVCDHMTGESRAIGGEQLQHANRLMTKRLLEKSLGPKQAESVATNILLKIVPTLSVCLRGEAVTSQKMSDIRVETNVNTSVADITPEVSEDGNMFRLRCQQPGVFHCTLTGLLLEGTGDVVYQLVPWDLDFLSSKGLRPAGPLFRFTLLTGNFHRLHLPHCQRLSGSGHHVLLVAHVTGDGVDFITPGQVTDSHVIIDVSGFSCFGLVTWETSSCAIDGLALLFFQRNDCSLFVLLLPRNVCLSQVKEEWKHRVRAEYVETVPNCELIPNQMYKLSGQPVSFIQPESSKFVNFSDYNNFLPSFHVQLEADVWSVELQLSSHVTVPHLIGWPFGSAEPVVWRQIVQLRAAASTVCTKVCASESVDVTLLLLKMLNSLRLEDLRTFQYFLALRDDPIPYSRLEAADRTRTVDLMVQQYHTDGAKQVAEDILRMMNHNLLADELQRNWI